MITNKELNAVKLSPTKKDFYQIWNELLDTAGKISERWDPASTNESDPGIVLLKVLTAVADKLNYNIDANTLEAFMPSAAQEDSMRKLTEMMGYNMKYYQSATTEVKISYDKNITQPINGILVIDKFTNIKDIDDSINYITLKAVNLTSDNTTENVECMEGALIECETDDNNIVSMFHLDDNRRYFLPETQIAENGIFITNVVNNIESTEWTRVSNLNAQSLGSKVFKFGFDSHEGLPYIQFPEDISTIIEDGLRIKYVRTSGAGGNISVNTLTKLTTPVSWTSLGSEDKDKDYYNVDSYTVSNIRSTSNGANKEGINSAYNNFKKTIGTFDTLVTCRDYMNKIYQLVSETDKSTPLVSNIIVSDIKSDINRAVTLGTFTSRGIEYKAIAKPGKDLTHFDLMLYPFKSTYNLNSKKEFEKSFNYDSSKVPDILDEVEATKTISHNFRSPEPDELACIKNYYKLRAKINTVRKVGSIEQANILTNVYTKLFEHFNMRQMEFGEEIPYETLLEVMENADPRIKSVTLDDPELTTKFCTVDNQEYTTADETLTDNTVKGNAYYNSLVLNNVLAGRVPLFTYDTNFEPNFNEEAYPSDEYKDIYNESNTETTITDDSGTFKSSGIHKIKTDLTIPVAAVSNGKTLTLTSNEVVQFRAPSFKTAENGTYPAYVNYYLHLDSTKQFVQAIPATMQTLRDFLRGGVNASTNVTKTQLEHYINETNFPSKLIQELPISSELRNSEDDFRDAFGEIENTSVAIFTYDEEDEKYVYQTADNAWEAVETDSETKFYTLKFSQDATATDGFTSWVSWIVNLNTVCLDSTDESYDSTEGADNTITLAKPLGGFYTVSSVSTTASPGLLVDNNYLKYKLVENVKTIATNAFTTYYLPRIWSDKAELEDTSNLENIASTIAANEWHTLDGLGQNTVAFKLPKNIEYQLKPSEYLLINYTHSASSESDEKVVENIIYSGEKGSIIKPNFELMDSEDYHRENHSYTKLNVEKNFPQVISSLPGMFTLGTDQQIEIRELATITLNKEVINIYWDIPRLISTEESGRLDFPWDEEPIDPSTGTAITTITDSMVKGTDYIYSAYTLREGESFYYTDMNKSDIAYYGFGTTIRRNINTPTIFKYTSDDLISTDEISSDGLHASIPWRTFSLSQTNGDLTLIENQFINLTEGDTLTSLVLANNEDEINSAKYYDVTSASYTFATDSSGSVSSLPPLDVAGSGFKWQVRSKLDLSMSPTKAQVLKTRPIEGTDKAVIDKLELYNSIKIGGISKDTLIETLTAVAVDGEYIPLSIKSNKIIQSASIETDVTTIKTSELDDSIGEEIIADLQLKLFKETVSKNSLDQTINFGNFGDGTFTTINFAERINQSDTSATSLNLQVPLNVFIPDGDFGLLMIYYENLNTDTTASNAKITATKTNNVKPFNEDDVDSWDGTLRKGINIIEIKSSDTITINSNYNNKAAVIFGSLSLIPSENALNPKLCYKSIDEDDTTTSEDESGDNTSVVTNYLSPYRQILKDIREIDTHHEFYYNIPIAGNLDIDMNEKDDQDTLENPLNWFNYNNINNNFVIAELDYKTLADGITIAKSSRSNF